MLVVVMFALFSEVIQIYPVHMIVEAHDIIEGIRRDEDKDFWRIERDMNMELALLCGASIDG